jgi:crotonobetainyl-CoA:carnitine CoA-transferase CaiB-like acyl-CoA transferase
VKGQEPMQVIANPITLSRSPATTRRGPPNFGEHDGEVLGDSVAW